MTDPTLTDAEDAETAPDYPPVPIEVLFFLDSEPEVRAPGLSRWLVVETLNRAADNLAALDEDPEVGEEEEVV